VRRAEGEMRSRRVKETTVKYMIMLKADEANQADRMPSDDELNRMGQYNDQLIAAGVLLAGEGLHPARTGSWVSFDGDEPRVTVGPSADSTELIAGFWILRVSSEDEALEWARRIPLDSGTVEVRRVFEVEDFDQDNEYVQKEVAWREEHEARTA
jgi:hypothetical protein